jgi:hypothetical protein
LSRTAPAGLKLQYRLVAGAVARRKAARDGESERPGGDGTLRIAGKRKRTHKALAA